MYQYIWDTETGGLLLTTEQAKFSKEPRPVYYKELDALGFDQHWNYLKDDKAPLMWAEANNYIYKGRTVAKTKGGSLFTKPELILMEEPEVGGELLQFVDIDLMCQKNRGLIETLAQESIKEVYNAYRQYQKKIDVFYVAFSGGKDSIVTLDIVQRALPHDSFKVLFGDTRMEFSDTYDTVENVRKICEEQNIEFHESRSKFKPLDSWSKFGPPCTVTRWCCSVHKTVPQILLLRDLLDKPDFTGMAFVGVRADESVARGKYDYISYGGKHKGQYSCNVILEWSSAEIFLYLYSQNLVFNETYKKGNRRAGCLVCPRAADRNDFMNYFCYTDEAEPFVNSIRNAYKRAFLSEERLEEFIGSGGWKARKNGRDIDIPIGYKEIDTKSNGTDIYLESPRTDWHEWIKTIGVVANDHSPYVIDFQGKLLHFSVEDKEKGLHIFVDYETGRREPEFVKLLKNVFRRAACCIGCQECQVDCPYGNMNFENGQVKISDSCYHCAKCHKVEKGCLIYKSLEQPKGGIMVTGKKRSLNTYSHHAPKWDWIKQYFEYKDEFDENHTLGSQMYNFFRSFLRDADLLDKSGFSETAKLVQQLGYEKDQSWGIIFTNLCYSPQVNWYVKNVDFDVEYSRPLLASMMVNAGAKESWTNDIFASLNRLSELPMGRIGFGKIIKDKEKATGIIRKSWSDPIPEIILYALYKFAEECDGYYQFSLEILLNDSIERNGVSPTRIFGLNKEIMIRILNGLCINYPDYISVSFTLDLDNITLREGKTVKEVLTLL